MRTLLEGVVTSCTRLPWDGELIRTPKFRFYAVTARRLVACEAQTFFNQDHLWLR